MSRLTDSLHPSTDQRHGVLTPRGATGKRTSARRHERGQGAAGLPADAVLLLFIALHLPLGILLRNTPSLAKGHALLVAAIGIGAALLRPRGDNIHLLAAGYVVGAEVLWRVVGTDVYHQFGKYAVILILGIRLLLGHEDQSPPVWPVLYLACLLPSAFFWLGEGWDEARNLLSFNLSGPATLAICCLYFGGRRLDARGLERLTASILAPIVATAGLGAYYLWTAGSALRFGLSSSRLAAGGFGPNQVSNTLGLGIILCWLLLSTGRSRPWFRVALLFTLLGLSTQAILTFSRGGVSAAALGIVATLPSLLSGRRSRLPVLLLSLVLIVAFVYVIVPWLIGYTGGKVALRYSDLDTTGRLELAYSELRVWLEHPLFGVGPGRARYDVDAYLGFELQAHVEFTRLLAEHGVLGLAALGLLLAGALRSYRGAFSAPARAWAAALLCYALAYMAQSAMRTAAAGFAYGLAGAVLLLPVPYPERIAHASALSDERMAHG